MQRVKIVTWNIGGGYIYERKSSKSIYNLNYFIEKIKRIDPDIICLQEINIPIRNLEGNQAKEMAVNLNIPFISVTKLCESHLKKTMLSGISILSKHYINNEQCIILTNPRLEQIQENGEKWHTFDKGFLKTRIRLNNRLIYVITGHTVPFHYFNSDFSEKRFENIRNEIEGFILNDLKYPIIVCADMNYKHIEKLIPNVFKSGFKSVQNDRPTTPTDKVQDHIFFTKNINLIYSRVIKSKADHYLCLAELDIPVK